MVVELGAEAEAVPTLPTPVRLLPCMWVNVLGEGGLLTKAVTTVGEAEWLLTCVKSLVTCPLPLIL